MEEWSLADDAIMKNFSILLSFKFKFLENRTMFININGKKRTKIGMICRLMEEKKGKINTLTLQWIKL